MHLFYKNCCVLLLIYAICSGCRTSDKQNSKDWNFDKSEITGIEQTNHDQLAVDIYLDVTGSMEGFCFALPHQDNYSNFLEGIEATCKNSWAKTDIKYYKYGSRVDSIDREQFVSAKHDKKIFTDKELLRRTDFANAIRQTNPNRMSILVTDLFYRNNDINPVVDAITDHCINKGIEIGLIGIESDFHGSVGDLGSGVRRVPVNSTRPLYALILGDKANISWLFSRLSNNQYIKQKEFFLITNKPTQSFDVFLEKNRMSKTIKNIKTPKHLDAYGTVYSFRMDEEDKDAALTMSLTINPLKNTVSYSTNNLIKPMVYKKVVGLKDSVVANDEINFTNLKWSGNKLSGDIQLKNANSEGNYIYSVYFYLDNITPLEIPNWVRQKNTATYGQVENDTKKTLNFERLISNLVTSHTTIAKPRIAKFYIYLEKK